MSTANDPKGLTRKELRSFLPSERAVRAFERLFELIPPDLNDINAYLDEIKTQPLNVSADYDILPGNYIIMVDASGGPITVTLPDVALAYSVYTGSYFVIEVSKMDSSTNAVIVAAQSGQTIFDSASFNLVAQNEIISVVVEPSTTNWTLG